MTPLQQGPPVTGSGGRKAILSALCAIAAAEHGVRAAVPIACVTYLEPDLRPARVPER